LRRPARSSFFFIFRHFRPLRSDGLANESLALGGDAFQQL
jgi:hypothetical protein